MSSNGLGDVTLDLHHDWDAVHRVELSLRGSKQLNAPACRPYVLAVVGDDLRDDLNISSPATREMIARLLMKILKVKGFSLDSKKSPLLKGDPAEIGARELLEQVDTALSIPTAQFLYSACWTIRLVSVDFRGMILQQTKTSFSNEHHEHLLRELFAQLMDGEDYPGTVSPQWKQLGFQGKVGH
jgi:hypothetical protein